MKNKALHLIGKSTRNSIGLIRTIRRSSSHDDAILKDVRRIRAHSNENEWKPYFKKNTRNWKAHCKCRHQWEKHDFPVTTQQYIWCWNMVKDHNRRWILDRLHKKQAYIFDVHNNDFLYDVLVSLYREGICTEPRRVKNGFYEVSLFKNNVTSHHYKESYSVMKITKGKYRRRNKQRKHQVECKMAIDAVAERTRRVSRKDSNGISLAPLPFELFVPHSEASIKLSSTVNAPLRQLAKDDHIKGINRDNKACLTLLNNYNHYSPTPKAHDEKGLKSYEHDYRNFHNALEQCCAWLTGRQPSDFPPWVMKYLTYIPLEKTIAQRLFSWTLGNDSPRKCYGLSKNEAHEIIHLPANIENEQQAIVASIARVHNCNDKLIANLVRHIPNLYNLFDENHRNFIRKLTEWLSTLRVSPTSELLHDLLDFFWHTSLHTNQFTSFKGRSLQSVEHLMQEWHRHQQQERQLAEDVKEVKWTYRGYNYCIDNSYYFHEITSAQELMKEGQIQHNCVFSYLDACFTGRTTIVSMLKRNSDQHLTIEINNISHSIVQIRSVCNHLATGEEMRIVSNYASFKNLFFKC